MYDISFQCDHLHSRKRVLYFPVIVAVLVFKKLFHASLIKFEGFLPCCKLNIVNSTTVVAKIKENSAIYKVMWLREKKYLPPFVLCKQIHEFQL